MACAILAIFVAGCTQPAPQPVTPVPTTEPIVTPMPVVTPLIDQEILGTWYLAAMTGPGGSSPVQTMNVEMNAIFSAQGGLSGFAGCNNFNTQYTLTGAILPNGKSITVGTIASTLVYCAGVSDLETTYLQILQKATSYSVTGNQLTITDNLGSELIFQRTPYGPTAVPRGL